MSPINMHKFLYQGSEISTHLFNGIGILQTDNSDTHWMFVFAFSYGKAGVTILSAHPNIDATTFLTKDSYAQLKIVGGYYCYIWGL